MSRRPALLGALGLLAIACATVARPPVLSEADSVSTTPAAKEAALLAPQAFAEAERIRRKAAAEHDDGDTASAQILGEHALAAYAHAFVLARLAKADKRLVESEAALGKAQRELAALDEKQRFVLAEADDLEKRVRMLKDALPLVPNAQASPEREKARLEAARAMSSQARLLCLASRMLGDSKKELGEALAKLDSLDAQLAKGAAPVPIDEAVRLRSACLSQLTLVRRDKTRQAPADGRTDALLEELSRSGNLLPFRDDRGVVVVLRGTPKELADRLTALARAAKAHPEFPLLVVAHSAKGKPSADDAKRAQAIADALRQAGAPKVETHNAGGAQPIGGSPARNQRVEIVFVAPTS
jgi:hypothetical protein